MARTLNVARVLLISAAVLVAVLIAIFVVLTRTDFGVEQAGRYAVERLRASIHGELRVGSVTSRGLLRGVTLHDVAIDDADGRPFIRADSARLAYHFRTLAGGDLAFDRLFLYSPEVHIERLPGQDDWNYERVFPGDSAAPDTTATRGLVLIDDVVISDGLVFVRLPWEPIEPVQPADTARLILEAVPGGTARVLRFEDVEGRLPRIVWQSPDDDAKVIRVGELAARAYIWETPVEVRRIEGLVTIRDSVLSFEAPRVQLPDSRLEMVGRVTVGAAGNRYDIQAEGDDLAFADFQWLYPPLPEDGGGALRFRIQSQGTDNILWLAEDARLRTGGTRVAGSFGVVTGDSVYFTNVSLEASPLDLELLQSLLPGELPLEGLLIGTVEVDGPISALRTRGDVRYRPSDGATTGSAARWAGTVRARQPYAVSGLDADLDRVDLGQVARFVPALLLRGDATGRIRADGSLARGLSVTGELSLEQAGSINTVRGGGNFAVGGNRSRFDLQFDAEPLSLGLLAGQFPALARLTGEARGPVTVTGSLDDLRVDADITTPAGGLALKGAFDLTGPRPRYRAEGAVTDFRLDRVVDGIPLTTVTARFDLDGDGETPEELAGRLALQIATARVDEVTVHAGVARISAAGGVILVDTLDLTTEVGDLAASGTLGLAPGRSGDLRFALRADSLGALEARLVPPAEVPDTSLFPPARLAGVVNADGVVTGSIQDWSVEGRGTVRDGVFGDIRVRRGSASGGWSPGTGRLAVTATVDSLAAGHRILARGTAQVQYQGGEGDAVAEGQGPAGHRLAVAGAFARIDGGARFTLHRLDVDTREGQWALADSAGGRLGRDGFGIEPTVLARARDGARIELAGVLPWSDPTALEQDAASFQASVENLRIGEVLRLTQTDTVIDGAVTGHLSVAGTALAPVVQGLLTTRGFRYEEATLDSLLLDLRYADLRLDGRLAAWRGDEEIIHGEGVIPVDLALADLGERRLDRPMAIGLTADSVPAGLVAFLAPGFSRLAGIVDAALQIGGTPLNPRFQGDLRITGGSGYFQHSGVHYRQVDATAVMRDTELAIEGTLRTGSGAGRIRGTLDIERPTDPGFDLELVAQQLEASRRRDVVAVADGRVRLGGRYSAPVVSGAVRLTEGELNLGEIIRQYRIVQLEPWFYEVFDPAGVGFRAPRTTPFLANMRVSDATITVDRGFWLRGPELNVEVAGELGVEYDRRAEDLRLSGTLQAVRGTYELRVLQNSELRLLRDLPGRRFDIRSGTIEFVGTPGIDPNLDIDATYRLRRPQGEPLDVVAQLAGTLQAPRVRLTSESDLPISESDLASYIIFGRSLSELSQSESEVLSSRTDRAGALIMNAVLAPTVSGLATSTLQSVLGVDYVAFTAAPEEWQLANLDTYGAFLEAAQLELGTYAFRGGAVGDVFLVGTIRLPRGSQPGAGLLSSVGGMRAEWRFRPTWTSEIFVEDRFARTPSFGLQEIEDRRVWGLSLFREWTY